MAELCRLGYQAPAEEVAVKTQGRRGGQADRSRLRAALRGFFRRDRVLKVHSRGDATRPRTGVFSTRSPDSANPLGLHRARVLEMNPDRVRIGPIEANRWNSSDRHKAVIESKDY